MAFQCVRCHTEIDRNFKACPHCGEPVTDFLRRYAEQPVDGKYRIIERLGAGGMGDVYKVEHVFLKAIRVIKVIRPQISESSDAHDRFLREAQLATKVQHPNVATLHDFSALPDGSHYMVWEFIDGENLAQVIRRRGVLAPAHAVRLAIQALSGLEAIHRAGIIHRDISPENLMITRDERGNERVKIIDLGVAKTDEGDYAVTRTGIFVGKLRYSSPEQLGFLPEGEKIDGRADLYSLAIVLYEMLTGRPPFEATSPHQYLLHHSQENGAQSLDIEKAPGGTDLQRILFRALERDRNKRFATAQEFAEALERVELTLPTQEDDTLRVTPPPSSTQARTQVLPQRAEPTQAATVITNPPQVIAQQKPRRQTGLLMVIVVLVLAFGALATWHFRSQPSAIVTNTIAAPQPQPATPATATVSVAPAPSPASPAAEGGGAPQPIAVPVPPPASVARPAPQPKKAAVKPVETSTETVEPQETQPEPEQTASHVFNEGGDGSRNDAAIAFARERLRGVSRVSLDARGDPDLIKQLGDLLSRLNLTVAEGSPVRIRFYGTVKHLRFGRKERAAEATILKNGQPVFRYELKPEEYRVGDNPAEAFARKLSDVFGR